ncbi:MAG: hypothetical protein R2854_25305 [Caldilineaceae bacterium]
MAITAPCAFVESWSAVLIGAVAGLLVCWATALLERVRIDDPVEAVPVHMVNGMWGVLAVGIFAHGGAATDGWNGVAGPVTGLLYGDVGQLFAQVSEAAAIVIVVGGLSWVFFKILNALGILRSSAHDELAGLDIPEMGMPGYTSDDVVMHNGRINQRFSASSSGRAIGAPLR